MDNTLKRQLSISGISYPYRELETVKYVGE